MGYSLFAYEDIAKGTYIIRYTGKHKNTFDADDCSYVAKVTYKNQRNEDVTFYIDAKKTKCLAKYTNHSCEPNAVLSKIIVSETKNPSLWLNLSLIYQRLMKYWPIMAMNTILCCVMSVGVNALDASIRNHPLDNNDLTYLLVGTSK